MQAMTSSSYLYGYMDTIVSVDFETHFLGTARLQLTGRTAYLLFSAKELQLAIPKLTKAEAATPMTTAKMKEWVEGLNSGDTELTEDFMKTIKQAGVEVRHVKVQAGECLIVPPGTLVACSVLRQEKVSGVRRYFLTAADSARASFAALLACSPESGAEGAHKYLKSTLDSMSVATAA